MDKSEILGYIMQTPGNTNPSVLRMMLDQLSTGESDDDKEGTGVLNVEVLPQEAEDGTLAFVAKNYIGTPQPAIQTVENLINNNFDLNLFLLWYANYNDLDYAQMTEEQKADAITIENIMEYFERNSDELGIKMPVMIVKPNFNNNVSQIDLDTLVEEEPETIEIDGSEEEIYFLSRVSDYWYWGSYEDQDGSISGLQGNFAIVSSEATDYEGDKEDYYLLPYKDGKLAIEDKPVLISSNAQNTMAIPVILPVYMEGDF